MEKVPSVRAAFHDFEQFKDALKSLKDSGMTRYEAFGPTELADIEDLMPRRGYEVRVWATVGAILGLALFWLMCVFTSEIFSIIVGGKPPVSNVPFIIPAYEGTILLGSVMAFVGVLILAKFGDHPLDPAYDPAYTEDTYGIHVFCGPWEKGRVVEMLANAGATRVDEP